ncbi:MAG TPA: hypothetical protein ENK18_17790 [Deltaproteobacteria bacterium]|nr:hypothetical protein [Deltaproteobacteria bacterium]
MHRRRTSSGLLLASAIAGAQLACAGLPAGLPELPELPELSELPELPDLPDLPELPELPELADLRPSFLPIPLEHDLEKGSALAAAALGERAVGDRFPSEVAQDCEAHAERFTWLAARHDEPEVITAALWAMIGCREQLHPPDARQVAIGRMRHDDPAVVGGALLLAAPLVPELEPGDALVQGVVDVAISEHGMPLRIAALDVLDGRTWSLEPQVSIAFYDALMADTLPSLTAIALERLRFRGVGLTLIDKPRFRAAAMVLAGDIDPGIRGFAALALARLEPEDHEVQGRILGLLDDKHPYTRSAASDALADMGYREAIHELVRRLDDREPNIWRMLPWTRIDGERARLEFVGSRLERVDDAHLRALERLTADLEEPFVYREINLRYKDLDILAATRDAQRWYEANGESIPRR